MTLALSKAHPTPRPPGPSSSRCTAPDQSEGRGCRCAQRSAHRVDAPCHTCGAHALPQRQGRRSAEGLGMHATGRSCRPGCRELWYRIQHFMRKRSTGPQRSNCCQRSTDPRPPPHTHTSSLWRASAPASRSCMSALNLTDDARHATDLCCRPRCCCSSLACSCNCSCSWELEVVGAWVEAICRCACGSHPRRDERVLARCTYANERCMHSSSDRQLAELCAQACMVYGRQW